MLDAFWHLFQTKLLCLKYTKNKYKRCNIRRFVHFCRLFRGFLLTFPFWKVFLESSPNRAPLSYFQFEPWQYAMGYHQESRWRSAERMIYRKVWKIKFLHLKLQRYIIFSLQLILINNFSLFWKETFGLKCVWNSKDVSFTSNICGLFQKLQDSICR